MGANKKKRKNSGNKREVKSVQNAESIRNAEDAQNAEAEQAAEDAQNAEAEQAAEDAQNTEAEQAAEDMQNAEAEPAAEDVQNTDAAPEPEKKRSSGSKVRTVLGIAIILIGICVCMYPFYRQKKSDDFNEEAINMILTPHPTKEGAVHSTKEGAVHSTKEGAVQPTQAGPVPATEVPELTGMAQAVPTSEPDEPENADITVLGEDLMENPDAPDAEETDDEKENANRLGGKTVIGVIQIPKIELIYAIVEGSDAAEIGVAIGHMSSTAKLGEIGNCALAGHRGGYSGPYFKNLDKLEIGDEVIITNANQEVFTYKVTEKLVVEPDEVWVIEDTGEDIAMLTLVTCENDGAERLIVRCVIE